MAKRKPPTRTVLCRACAIVRDQRLIHPTHVVHPVTGEPRLFDVYGIALCPTCGARRRRVRNAYDL